MVWIQWLCFAYMKVINGFTCLVGSKPQKNVLEQKQKFYTFYWLKFTYFIGFIRGNYVALSPTFFELYKGLSNFLNGFLGHGQTKVEMAGWGITWRV